METETKTEAKVDTPVPRNTTFSLLVVDDEVTTRNLCQDVADDALSLIHI